MKSATIIHNPSAGNEAYSKKELVALIESFGFECKYFSAKEKQCESIDTDFVVVAGGDGTVRKVAKMCRNMSNKKKVAPIALLPLGTANNISKTYGIEGKTREIIQRWHHANLKPLDIGKITGLPVENFFLEGIGFGVFPSLIKKMEKQDYVKHDTPEKQLVLAISVLKDIIKNFQPRFAKIEIEGTVHSGNFLIVEVMNMKSVGPNLHLAPLANPGDGEFEVVMIPESQRDKLLRLVSNMEKGISEPLLFDTLKAKNLSIHWEESYLHVDDEYIETNAPINLSIKVKPGAFEILV